MPYQYGEPWLDSAGWWQVRVDNGEWQRVWSSFSERICLAVNACAGLTDAELRRLGVAGVKDMQKHIEELKKSLHDKERTAHILTLPNLPEELSSEWEVVEFRVPTEEDHWLRLCSERSHKVVRGLDDGFVPRPDVAEGKRWIVRKKSEPTPQTDLSRIAAALEKLTIIGDELLAYKQREATK